MYIYIYIHTFFFCCKHSFFLQKSKVNKHPAYQFTYSVSSDLENTVVKVAEIYSLNLAALNGRFPSCWLPQLGQRESFVSLTGPVGRIWKICSMILKPLIGGMPGPKNNSFTSVPLVHSGPKAPICRTHTTLRELFSIEL